MGDLSRFPRQVFIAFDAERLQSDGFVEAADKHMGPEANTNRDTRGGTGVIAFKRSRTHIGGWREHLSRAPQFRPEDVQELEAHLRDSVARWRTKGLSDEEAFLIAAGRLGGDHR